MSPSSIAVLHTIPDLKSSSGGSRKLAADLCVALGACGAKVVMVSQTHSSPAVSNLILDPKYVHTHLVTPVLVSGRLRVAYAPSFEKSVSDQCVQNDIEIIHNHGLWLPSNHAAAKVARGRRIPMVTHLHGMLQPVALSTRYWKKRLAWWIYQKKDIQTASLFVASSDQEAETIRRAGFRQPVAIVPNAVHMPAWADPIPKVGKMRYALFLSRIHPIKGLLNLVAAWSHVRPAGWRVIVAGPDEGSHLREVKRAVENAGLQPDFEFTGMVEGAAKERLYRDADLFILPSLSENFGLVVAEALSYGVPVITTRGTPWQDLETNHCGWWVEVGVQPLVEAIQTATSLSNAQRQDMGRRGRSFVAKSFSVTELAREMLAVYEWIRRVGPKPASIV